MRISDWSSDVCSSDLATTPNPSQKGGVPWPSTEAEIPAYFENYLPIRIARALKAKLYHKTRYWTVPEMANTPFVIALQDFHAPASMSTLTPAIGRAHV